MLKSEKDGRSFILMDPVTARTGKGEAAQARAAGAEAVTAKARYLLL
jgi:hypothetical protein